MRLPKAEVIWRLVLRGPQPTPELCEETHEIKMKHKFRGSLEGDLSLDRVTGQEQTVLRSTSNSR